MDGVGVINNNIVDEETYYQSTLIPKGDYDCGHACIVTILNKDGIERDSITLHSDNFIVGVQYLATNTDGNYIIKQYDMDLTDKVEETIRTIDRNHNVVSVAGSCNYMPYCWGGFSTPSQYKAGMTNGGRVGNINTSTAGHVSNTYGLDCSGYVSRCWGLTSKRSTSTLPIVLIPDENPPDHREKEGKVA